MPHRNVYKKSTKGGAGAHGVDYQLNILTLFLLEAYRCGEEFWLSTENEKAGKFDDVVLETNNKTVLLQAKHKEDPEDRKNFITFNDLFPIGRNREDFNVPKYAKSFSIVNKNFNNIKSVILCTNTILTVKEDDLIKHVCCKKMTNNSHLFYFSDKKYYYNLNRNCRELLFNLNIHDNVDDFLEKFQLISITDQSVISRIIFLIKKIDLFDACFDHEQAVSFLKENIKIWFESEKGTYLTRSHVDAFRSLYFIKKLEKLNVNIKPKPLEAAKYICYVIQKKKNLNLHLLKIYKQLKIHKILIVDYKETVRIKEKIISAFKLRDFVYMVIPIFREDYEDLKKIILNCVKISKDKLYKNIIFITDELKVLAKLCKDLEIQIQPVVESVKFEDFSKKSKNEICSSTNIIYQGKTVSLKEIVSPNMEKLNNLLDESTLLKLLKKKKLFIHEYKDDVINFYISRSIFSIEEEISMYENQFCDVIAGNTENKTILITDSPGMGKTTLLYNLQKLLIAKYNFVVIKIHLNECTRIFRNISNDGQNLITLKELFIWLKNPNEFELNIFNLPSKVIVLFDAFDEISPNYSKIALNLIKSCEISDNIKKIVITSRQHCETDITESIVATCFSLEPFSVKQQQDFLYRYWVDKLELTTDDRYKCERYVDKLLSTLTNAMESWNLIGIPLQSQIVAHIFRKDCLEYVRSNNFKIVSLDKLNIAKLYDRFIQEKKSIYIDEKTNAPGNELENILSTNFDKSIREEHTEMAVQITFDNGKHRYFFSEKRGSGMSKLYNFFFKRVSSLRSKKNFNDDQVSLHYLLEMGILQKSGDSLQFIHRTFAEYLVAKHICESLNESNNKQKLFHFLLDEIFLLPRYTTVRSFMNDILEDQTIPAETLKMCGEITVKLQWRSYICSGLARNRLYNLLNIMLKECDNCEDIFMHRIGNGMDLLILTLPNLPTFKLLVEKGASLSKTYGNDKKLLHFAVSSNCKEIVEYLIENDDVDINYQDNKGYTPLHYAAAKNLVSILEILLKNDADINVLNFYKESALFSAVEQDSVDALNFLIQAGLNVNDKNDKNCTPLLTACFYSSYNCVNFLLDHGAEISVSDFSGFTIPHFPVKVIQENFVSKQFTVLHFAVLAKNLTLLKLLITAGLDLEVKDFNGRSPLILAGLEGELVLLKYIISSGADVSSCDNDGCNVLHYLAKLKVIVDKSLYEEVVIEVFDKICGDFVDRVCKKGKTALFYAVKANNIVMMKFLLSKGADKRVIRFQGSSKNESNRMNHFKYKTI